MEKERKITAPDGCEIEKVEIVGGVAVVTFKEKERKLPKSWEEFCEKYPIKDGECVINSSCIVAELNPSKELNFMGLMKAKRHVSTLGILPDRATAEAVLALCQLIQLRNCYNGDWVPKIGYDDMYTIDFTIGEICKGVQKCIPEVLMFKTSELCDEFLRNFRDLIEKIKPLYGIKKEKYIKVEDKGGEE